MIYPNSTPEFRIFIRQDGTQSLQVRYVNITQNYVSAWKDVPTITETQNDQSSQSNT